MERQITKRENFFSVELREGEQITIAVNDGSTTDSFVFVVPEDMTLNGYMKRKSTAIQWVS